MSIPISEPYPWQQSLWSQLQTLVAADSLPHALMFCGPAGTGKLALAELLAELLLCHASEKGRACGHCKNCHMIRSAGHPDLLYLMAEEGTRIIKVDQVRKLVDFMGKTSQQGGRKVVVLAAAENLNINAANALLKNLEEPSGAAHLLLVSHNPGHVLATIRSRCMLINCDLPEPATSLAWLQSLAGEADARQLLQFAAGAPLRALDLLSGDSLKQLQSLERGLRSIACGDQSPLQLAAEVGDQEPLQIIDCLVQWLHRALRLQAGTGQSGGAGESLLDDVLARMAQPRLYRYLDRLLAAKGELLGNANPNRQLLLEEIFLDWQALARESV